jgi:hypothetical protein
MCKGTLGPAHLSGIDDSYTAQVACVLLANRAGNRRIQRFPHNEKSFEEVEKQEGERATQFPRLIGSPVKNEISITMR